MHGLVSVLDSLHQKMVESIWHELEVECGLNSVMSTPFPHFSWLIAEDFDWPGLEIALQEVVAELRPFHVRAGGLALFTGSAPVVYIPIVRTRELSDLHERIWQRAQPHGEAISPLYSPSRWMPHITLVYGDASVDSLACVMKQLAERIYNWEMDIDNLTLIYQVTGQVGAVRARYEFST